VIGYGNTLRGDDGIGYRDETPSVATSDLLPPLTSVAKNLTTTWLSHVQCG
jgi:hypothetical protein